MDHAKLLQYAASAIICLDEKHNIILFNHHAEEIFGYTAAEILGKPLQKLLPLRFATLHTSHINEFGQSSEPARAIRNRSIVWGLRKDGTEFPAEVGISKVEQADGSVVFTAVLNDVSARLRTEQELEQRNRELTLLNYAARALISSLDINRVLTTLLEEVRTLLKVAACSVWLVDPADGSLVCRQMTDPHDVEVIGWRLPKGIGLSGWVVEHRKSLIVADAWADERHFRGIDEETRIRIRSILTVPLRGKEEIIGVIQLVDTQANRFTERDQKLLELMALEAAIAIENAALFAELKETQAQLVQQERLAALGQMAATVAHELRNPLMAIRMGVEYLLRDVGERDPRRRGALLMQSNMDRIERLMQDILFMGRAPSPQLAPALLRPLLLEEIERWQLTLQEKRLRLHSDLASNLPPLMLDPQQMMRAITNLIANSVDVLPPGGEIHLSLYAEDHSQVIRLQDNGPGISPEHLPKVFEPFFTTKSRGTGLGLSIVKQIVEQHQGTIRAGSDAETGTTFWLSLPDAGRIEQNE